VQNALRKIFIDTNNRPEEYIRNTSPPTPQDRVVGDYRYCRHYPPRPRADASPPGRQCRRPAPPSAAQRRPARRRRRHPHLLLFGFALVTTTITILATAATTLALALATATATAGGATEPSPLRQIHRRCRHSACHRHHHDCRRRPPRRSLYHALPKRSCIPIYMLPSHRRTMLVFESHHANAQIQMHTCICTHAFA
jgi:hypothetical protein